ncbi:phosphatase PAP2 family protein [Siminovitchia sediminis]|uniref:Phosphatase PAP2 family protein n=1 Tax=Siminovitchia sediminis TaxID=1274353 RepID=A0ABW4KH86_9BACI
MPFAEHIDREVLTFFNEMRTDPLTSFFLNATELGSITFLFPLAVLASMYFLIKKHVWRIIFLMSVLWGARGLNELIKHMVGRHRPDMDPIIQEAGNSFPSGHSMNSAAVYGYFMYLALKNNNPKRYVWVAVFTGVILTVAASRLYLGVHYLTDVTAGITGGLALVFLGIILEQPLKNLIAARRDKEKGK